MNTSTTYEEQKVKKTKDGIRKKWEELSPEERNYLVKAGLLIAADAVFMGVFIGEHRMKKCLMKKKITLWSARQNKYCTKSREDLDAWMKNETLSKREIFGLNKEAVTLLDAAEYMKNNGGIIKIEYNDK